MKKKMLKYEKEHTQNANTYIYICLYGVCYYVRYQHNTKLG